MELERLLELCDLLRECELLPAGNYRVWAHVNVLREIRRIIYLAQFGVMNGNTSAAPRE